MEQKKNIEVIEVVLLEVVVKLKKRKGVVVDKKYIAKGVLNLGTVTDSDLRKYDFEIDEELLKDLEFGTIFYLLENAENCTEEEKIEAVEKYNQNKA